MIRPLAIAITLLITASVAHAQQQAVLSQYMLNNYYFNPACTGSDLYNFTVLHRTQWSGYQTYNGEPGGPSTQLFTGTFNIDSTGHGFGLVLAHDRTGLLNSFDAGLSYSYRVQLSGESTLALGIRGGVMSRSVDASEYIIKHPDDPNILEGDNRRESKADVVMGVWFNHTRYYAGISARGFVTQGDYETLGIENEKSIVATAGYHFIPSRQVTVTPSAQMITNTNRTLLQGGVMVAYNHILWGGLYYRHDESATALAGFNFLKNKFKLGYAFDYTTRNRELKTGTSHEIMLTFRSGTLHVKS